MTAALPVTVRFGVCEATLDNGHVAVSFPGQPDWFEALPLDVFPQPHQPVVCLSTYDRLIVLGSPAATVPAAPVAGCELSKDDDNGLTVDGVGLIKQPFIVRSGSWVGDLVAHEATVTFDYIRDGIDLDDLAVFAQIGDAHGFTDYRVQTPPTRRTRESMVVTVPGAPPTGNVRINWLIVGKETP